MRQWFLGVALGLTLAVAAAADDPPNKDDPPKKDDAARKDDAPKSPAEQFQALKKEVDDANAEVTKALRERKDPKDKEANDRLNKAAREWQAKQAENAAKAVELARANPKSEVAAEALAWALQGLRGKPDAVREAIGLIKEHHLDSPKIQQAINIIQYAGLPDRQVDDFLTAVAEKNSDKATRATALMVLGERYKSRAAPSRGKPPANAEELQKKAEDIFERVAGEFADVKSARGPSLAERAKGELFELRHLSIGKVAPDIEAEDLDGVKFKLSDYRGKVVLLDFWGDW
jgi:hypothetical protein